MNFRNCIAALALMFMAASAANAIVIDNFNSGGGFVMGFAGDTVEDSSATDPGDALGNMRRLEIPGSQAVVGPLPLIMAANPGNPGTETFTFSLPTGTSGSGKLVWDADRQGLGGIDLTDGGVSDQLSVEVLVIDQGQVNMIFSFTDINNNTSTVELTDAVIGTNNISFLDIVGSANLSELNMVMLEIQGTEASDLQIDLIASTNSVPEPASAALLGLGALGFLRRRRAA